VGALCLGEVPVRIAHTPSIVSTWSCEVTVSGVCGEAVASTLCAAPPAVPSSASPAAGPPAPQALACRPSPAARSLDRPRRMREGKVIRGAMGRRPRQGRPGSAMHTGWHPRGGVHHARCTPPGRQSPTWRLACRTDNVLAQRCASAAYGASLAPGGPRLHDVQRIGPARLALAALARAYRACDSTAVRVLRLSA